MSEINKPIEIKMDNTATFFTNYAKNTSGELENIGYRGACQIAGEMYDATLTARTARNGTDYYSLAGTHRTDQNIKLQGAVFMQEAKTSNTGRPRPSFNGKIKISPSGQEYEISIWDKIGKTGKQIPYLSAQIRQKTPKAA